jgi:hypothetical protein
MAERYNEVPNPEAVEELLTVVRSLTEDERARGQSLDAKTSTLAGFSGAILALTATLGAGLFERDLGDIAPAVQALFVIAVAMLAGAAALSIGGVLRPQPHLRLSMDEIRRFREFPVIATQRMEIQGQMLATLVEALAAEREINERKARLTQFAARALVGGYVAVAAMAVTFAVA